MRKAKTVKAGCENQGAAPSPEFVAFEKLAQQVIQMPKTEIDRREAEYQKQRKRRKGQP